MSKDMKIKTNLPQLTVIVPAYNAGRYLEKCLDSILAQTFTDFELILVNDGSKDNTPSICDSYAKRDARIRVIHQENKGLVTTRKTAISLVQTPYVAFVDSDDWIDPDMYEKMMERIVETDSDVVTCSFIREYPKNQIVDLEYARAGVYEGEKLEELKKHLIWIGKDASLFKTILYTSYWNKIFKTKVLKPVLGEALDGLQNGEDFSVIVPALIDSKRIAVMRDFTPYHYRVITGSLSHSFKPVHFEAIRKLNDKLQEELARRGCTENQRLLSYYILRVIILGLEKAARSREIGLIRIGNYYDHVQAKYQLTQMIRYADPTLVDSLNRRLATCICSGSSKGLRYAIVEKYIKMRMKIVPEARRYSASR